MDNDGPPQGRNGGDNAVSNTRLYLGNVPRSATKADVEQHFATHGHGQITEIKLMSGFGFVEYKDPADARDVVPAFHGSDFMGERLTVQFARGPNRDRNDYGREPRQPPRPRRTVNRMTISGLSGDTSWQDLKDFARSSGLDVVFSEVGRDRDANGLTTGFVEYETEDDLKSAVEKLNETEFKGAIVQCVVDIQAEVPRPAPRERYNRSRSPGYRGGGRGYGGPPQGRDDYYDRRGPPARGYSPRRDDYRRRSPPRDYYPDARDDRGYAPPRRGPPPGDYPPPQRDRYDDRGYGGGAPAAPRGGQYEQDPYANGHGREPYPRHPSPPRRDGRSYERGNYDNRGPGGY